MNRRLKHSSKFFNRGAGSSLLAYLFNLLGFQARESQVGRRLPATRFCGQACSTLTLSLVNAQIITGKLVTSYAVGFASVYCAATVASQVIICRGDSFQMNWIKAFQIFTKVVAVPAYRNISDEHSVGDDVHLIGLLLVGKSGVAVLFTNPPTLLPAWSVLVRAGRANYEILKKSFQKFLGRLDAARITIGHIGSSIANVMNGGDAENIAPSLLV